MSGYHPFMNSMFPLSATSQQLSTFSPQQMSPRQGLYDKYINIFFIYTKKKHGIRSIDRAQLALPKIKLVFLKAQLLYNWDVTHRLTHNGTFSYC